MAVQSDLTKPVATFSANGNSGVFELRPPRDQVNLSLAAYGTTAGSNADFDGGTVILEKVDPSRDSFLKTDVQLDASQLMTAMAVPPGQYRLNLSGSTAPDLEIWVLG